MHLPTKYPSNAANQDPNGRAHPRILLVDAAAQGAKVSPHQLRKLGCDVEQRAIEECNGDELQTYQCVIVHVDAENSLAARGLLRDLRNADEASGRHTPLVAVVQQETLNNHRTWTHAGADEVIATPVSPESLQETLLLCAPSWADEIRPSRHVA